MERSAFRCSGVFAGSVMMKPVWRHAHLRSVPPVVCIPVLNATRVGCWRRSTTATRILYAVHAATRRYRTDMSPNIAVAMSRFDTRTTAAVSSSEQMSSLSGVRTNRAARCCMTFPCGSTVSISFVRNALLRHARAATSLRITGRGAFALWRVLGVDCVARCGIEPMRNGARGAMYGFRRMAAVRKWDARNAVLCSATVAGGSTGMNRMVRWGVIVRAAE